MRKNEGRGYYKLKFDWIKPVNWKTGLQDFRITKKFCQSWIPVWPASCLLLPFCKFRKSCPEHARAVSNRIPTLGQLLLHYRVVEKIVTIPENVGWKEVGKRTKITYIVEFSMSDQRVFMTRKGWCWHGEYAKCANQILKDAKVAARKLPG